MVEVRFSPTFQLVWKPLLPLSVRITRLLKHDTIQFFLISDFGKVTFRCAYLRMLTEGSSLDWSFVVLHLIYLHCNRIYCGYTL